MREGEGEVSWEWSGAAGELHGGSHVGEEVQHDCGILAHRSPQAQRKAMAVHSSICPLNISKAEGIAPSKPTAPSVSEIARNI